MKEQVMVQFWAILSLGIVALIAFIVMRAAFGYQMRLHGYSYAQAMAEKNNAVYIRFAGVIFGGTLAFWGVISPTERGFLQDMITIFQCLVQVVVFMIVAGYVNDKLILSRIDNLKAIFKDGNKAVAILELATFIATGLIFSSSQLGDGGFLYNLIWFAIGQAVLIAMVFTYAICHGSQNGVDQMHENVGKGNMGYALSLGGFIISVGLVLHVLIINIDKPLLSVAALIMWVAVTLSLQFFMNRFIIPGKNLWDMIVESATSGAPSEGAGFLQGLMFLTSALIITVLN